MIVILCFAYKRRNLADYIFSMNCLLDVMLSFYPNQTNHDLTSQDVLDIHFLRFLAFSCAWSFDIAMGVLVIGVHLFIGITAVYDRPLDLPTISTYILQLIGAFLTAVLLNMLVILVSRINE